MSSSPLMGEARWGEGNKVGQASSPDIMLTSGALVLPSDHPPLPLPSREGLFVLLYQFSLLKNLSIPRFHEDKHELRQERPVCISIIYRSLLRS